MSRESITIGSGGGFVGKEHAYTVRAEDGAVYQQGHPGVIVAHLPPALVQEVLNSLRSIDVANIRYKVPGNMYSFVTYTDPDGIENRIVWDSYPRGQLPDYIPTLSSIKDRLHAEIKTAINTQRGEF